MALLTVEGVYKDGKVELSERPGSVGSPSRVLVTFLPAEIPPSGPLPESGEDRETLRRRAFERMKEGISLGGPPYPTREEIHDRFG